MKKGFTLVELSIVLVIIGLLISGLLVGQSMITSTKVQAQVKQFQQFDIAVENFKTMYGQLPGDTEYFSLTTGGCTAGDADGTIEDNNNNTGTDITHFDCEIAGFWNHLSQNGFGSTTFTQSAAAGINAGEHAPELKLGTGFNIAYGVSGTGYYHAFNFTASSDELDGANNLPALLASSALALDSKMDDSVANTGNVIAIGANDWLLDPIPNAVAGSAGCVITGSLGTYNVTYSAAEICLVRVNMLSQTTD